MLIVVWNIQTDRSKEYTNASMRSETEKCAVSVWKKMKMYRKSFESFDKPFLVHFPAETVDFSTSLAPWLHTGTFTGPGKQEAL